MRSQTVSGPNGIWIEPHLHLKIVYIAESIRPVISMLFDELHMLVRVIADIHTFHGLYIQEHFGVVCLELRLGQEGQLLSPDSDTVEHVGMTVEFCHPTAEFLRLVVVFLGNFCENCFHVRLEFFISQNRDFLTHGL
jgi:hypothetical protein